MPNVDPIYNTLGEERLAEDEAGPYVEMWDGEGWMRSGRVHRLASEKIAALEAERDFLKKVAEDKADAVQTLTTARLRADLARVTEERDELLAHAQSKVGDTVKEKEWDAVWAAADPPEGLGWEYPGQVIREVERRITRLKLDLAATRQELEGAHKQNASLIEQHDSMMRERDEANESCVAWAKDYEGVNERLVATLADLAAAQKDYDDLRNRYDATVADLAAAREEVKSMSGLLMEGGLALAAAEARAEAAEAEVVKTERVLNAWKEADRDYRAQCFENLGHPRERREDGTLVFDGWDLRGRCLQANARAEKLAGLLGEALEIADELIEDRESMGEEGSPFMQEIIKRREALKEAPDGSN